MGVDSVMFEPLYPFGKGKEQFYLTYSLTQNADISFDYILPPRDT
jgi:hypothetical protein